MFAEEYSSRYCKSLLLLKSDLSLDSGFGSIEVKLNPIEAKLNSSINGLTQDQVNLDFDQVQAVFD